MKRRRFFWTMRILLLAWVLSILLACSSSSQPTSSQSGYVQKRDNGAAGVIVNLDPKIRNLIWAEDKARGVVCYKFDQLDGIACLKGFATQEGQ